MYFSCASFQQSFPRSKTMTTMNLVVRTTRNPVRRTPISSSLLATPWPLPQTWRRADPSQTTILASSTTRTASTCCRTREPRRLKVAGRKPPPNRHQRATSQSNIRCHPPVALLTSTHIPYQRQTYRRMVRKRCCSYLEVDCGG